MKRSSFLDIILQHLVWYFFKSLILSYKFEVRGQENIDEAHKQRPGLGYLFGLWHEHIVSVMGAHYGKSGYMGLASRSKDGDYAALLLTKMGHLPIRGSSRKKNKDKGGSEAIEEMVVQLKKGINGAITIDGPKGPRHVCKPGIVILAMRTEAAILPVHVVPQAYWQFNSWDKFKLPKPFTRIIVEFGEPIFVTEKNPEMFDQTTRLIETRLLAMSQSGR